MNRTALAIGLTLAAALPAMPAQAQNAQTFVSGHGGDINNNICSVAAPCRTFQHAYTVTNASGEIEALDPAEYGTLNNIIHAISIEGHGFAAISPAANQPGIAINAGANDAINLRGLNIEGQGSGGSGVVFNTGGSLTVEDCVIRDLVGNGIFFAPNTNASSNLLVSNTLAADNGFGMVVNPTGSGTVNAVFNRVEAKNNKAVGIGVNGALSTGTINATVFESVAASNIDGFLVNSVPGKAATTLMLFHSVAANNTNGLGALGPLATIRVAQSMITGNANGWSAGPVAGPGSVLSYGDNYIDGNMGNQAAPPNIARK